MILITTEKLRQRLAEFRLSELYQNSKFYRQDAKMLEIAINIAEQAVKNDRVITTEDHKWFEGVYLIDHDFNGEWSDISDLYARLVDELRESGTIR